VTTSWPTPANRIGLFDGEVAPVQTVRGFKLSNVLRQSNVLLSNIVLMKGDVGSQSVYIGVDLGLRQFHQVATSFRDTHTEA
jgi:hypothetical protein